MARTDLISEFQRVEAIAASIEEFVPDDSISTVEFKGDLAGFLVVAMASSYENCVKIILVSHAAKKHREFEEFASRNFDRLNSRVRVDDLKRYAGLFDDRIKAEFNIRLSEKKAKISARTGHSIVERYNQVLAWRHAYAHSGQKNTTIREALEFHNYAKRVVYCFSQAFDSY